MIDSESINCSNLSTEEITKKIQMTIKKIRPYDKIFRIKLKNIPYQIYRSIDFNQIRKLCSGAVHFEIKSDIIREDERRISQDYRIISISNEFEKFLINRDVEEKNLLLKLGLDYINRIESKDEGK
jgi:hypothetical protein